MCNILLRPNLDYTIKVPDPQEDYSKNKEDCDFQFTLDEKRRPVVVLFGWAGTSDKYLSIYSKIYEAKGLMTIRYIVSVISMFYWKKNIYSISERMVKIIEDIHLQERPVIIHVFSNGGAYLYQHFMEALGSSRKPIIIKGVIFDSTPCRRTYTSAFRGIRPSVSQKPILNLPLSVSMMMTFFFIWTLERIERDIFGRNVNQFKPMDYLLKESNKCPQHFIYSRSDTVISYKDVEFFIKERKSIGVDVSVQCYEETAHVKHYPYNKYSYTQSIFNFISKCLDLNSSNV